jgi:transcriptional regulator with XRE-family HTH domain
MKTRYSKRDHAYGLAMQELRNKIGLTQGRLADRLGVSRRAVAEWEAGNSYPKIERLKELIALALQQQAFTVGHEAEEIRVLWKVSRQKALLDEDWLSTLLHQHSTSHPHVEPPHGAAATGLAPLLETSPLPTPTPPTPVEEAISSPPIKSGSLDSETRGRRNLLTRIVIALVLLTIIGATGLFFFHTRNHAADQAYPAYLSGKGTFVFHDPLSQESGSEWSSSSLNDSGGACQFIGGVYQVRQQTNTNKPFQVCPTRRTFSDFAFEVQLTIIRGDCGGIIFRMESPWHFYFFKICQNGTSYIRKNIGISGSDGKALWSSSPAISSVIHSDPGRQNKIAVVASGGMMTFYINEQKVCLMQDDSNILGNIALIADLYHKVGHPTDVAYSNARLWAL